MTDQEDKRQQTWDSVFATCGKVANDPRGDTRDSEALKPIDDAITISRTVITDLETARDSILRDKAIRAVVGFLVHRGHRKIASAVADHFFPAEEAT